MASVSELLADSPVLDGHNDLAYALREIAPAGPDPYDLAGYDLTRRQSRTHTDFVRMAEGGLGAQFWSVFVPCSAPDPVRETLEQIDAVQRLCARYPDRMVAARNAADVRSAWASGRVAALMGAEGGHSIANSLAVLRLFGELGVGYMTLTHNENTPWADSATDEPVHHGLTDFGRDVVREMNRIGMLVDLSHVSPDTMRDSLDTSTKPVIFSHSSARAVCDHPRNVPDDVLGRLSTNGGVCMVTFVAAFVSEPIRVWTQSVADELEAAGGDRRDWAAMGQASRVRAEQDPPPRATTAQVADHVERVREIAGIEHVGIGGDLDGCDQLPDGLTDVAGYPNLLAELRGRGWSDSDLARLTSGNILRVLGDAD